MKRSRVFLLLLVITTCTASYASNSKSETFKCTLDQAFDAAVKIAQSRWQVTVIDSKTHTLVFISHDRGTIGEGYSVAFDDGPDSGVKVTVVWYNTSEGIPFGPGKIADKLLKGIDDELAKQVSLRVQEKH